MNDYQDLSIAIDDGVALLTMERPETRNVISDEPLVHELADACQALNRRTDVNAVVLTGRGTAFSAGGNIRKMADGEGMFGGSTDEIATGYRRGIQTLIRAVIGLEVPSIAAINGPAIGAGFDLALACDLRLCSRMARFGEVFVNLGLVPGDGGAWLLPRVVGHARASELAFTGRVFDADEALQLGVVLSVHEPDELAPAALDLARAIAAKPAVALRYTKRLLGRASASTFERALDEAADIQAILHGTTEHRAALERALDSRRS